jgi:hypothetical protein
MSLCLCGRLTNLGLDKLGQQRERLLSSEMARLRWNDLGYPFLHDVQLGAAGNLPERNGACAARCANVLRRPALLVTALPKAGPVDRRVMRRSHGATGSVSMAKSLRAPALP